MNSVRLRAQALVSRCLDARFGGLFGGAAAAILLLALASCGPSGSQKDRAGGSLSDPVVAATVNGKPIYVTDVESEAVARGAIKAGEPLPETSAVFYQILEDLIETRLLASEAENRHLDQTPENKRRLEVARERLMAMMLTEDVTRKAVKESSVERMYREQVKLLGRGTLIHARHILVPTKEAALAAKRRLDQGELFEAVAYQVSQDRQTAADGGDLGYRSPENLPDGLKEAAMTAPLNKVIGPMQVPGGWELFRVEEKRTQDAPSLDSMRPQIEQWLMFDELRQMVEKLKGTARIARLNDEPAAGVSPQPGLPAPADAGDKGDAGEDEGGVRDSPAAAAPAPAPSAKPEPPPEPVPAPKPVAKPAPKPAPPAVDTKPPPVVAEAKPKRRANTPTILPPQSYTPGPTYSPAPYTPPPDASTAISPSLPPAALAPAHPAPAMPAPATPAPSPSPSGAPLGPGERET